ncbi:MAG: GNAT family N-acetyltransferase [Vicinamibacterales bacterium]
MADVVIRRATMRDEGVLLGLADRLATFDLPEWRRSTTVVAADGLSMLRAVQAAHVDDEVFIAERAERAEQACEPAGCLHIFAVIDFFGLHHAHVSVIATSSAAEGCGVGRALLTHAEDWARARGLRLLTLNVFASNTRARRFYERAGMSVEFVKYAKAIPADPL